MMKGTHGPGEGAEGCDRVLERRPGRRSILSCSLLSLSAVRRLAIQLFASPLLPSADDR